MAEEYQQQMAQIAQAINAPPRQAPLQEPVIGIPQSQFDIIAKSWNDFLDYCKRQNELDAVHEKQFKQHKTGLGFIELFLLVGTIAVSILTIFSFLILCYFIISGIPVGNVPLLLGATAAFLFFYAIFQAIRVWQSGEWFKFGLGLRKHKSGWIKFTKGRGLMLSASPYKQKQEFRQGKENTLFLTKEKGFHDPSTGGVIYTVREGAISDFDVDEEYKGKIEDVGKDVKSLVQESWFAGAVWNKIDLPALKMLIIIAICVSVLSLIIGAGSILTSNNATTAIQSQIAALDGNMSLKIAALDGNMSLKIAAIKNALPTATITPNTGVVP